MRLVFDGDVPDEAFAALSDFEAVFTVETVRLYELGDAGWTARTTYPLVG